MHPGTSQPSGNITYPPLLPPSLLPLPKVCTVRVTLAKNTISCHTVSYPASAKHTRHPAITLRRSKVAGQMQSKNAVRPRSSPKADDSQHRGSPVETPRVYIAIPLPPQYPLIARRDRSTRSHETPQQFKPCPSVRSAGIAESFTPDSISSTSRLP